MWVLSLTSFAHLVRTLHAPEAVHARGRLRAHVSPEVNSLDAQRGSSLKLCVVGH